MTITVASTDVANYNLQQQIVQVQALVNAPTINPAQNQQNLQTLAQLQAQLLFNLISNYQNRSNSQMGQGSTSYINPATALSSLTINA
jgi:hypothetical protein